MWFIYYYENALKHFTIDIRLYCRLYSIDFLAKTATTFMHHIT